MPLAASADGWRGIIGESFVPAAAARLADAALQVLGVSHGRRILVGFDARKASAASADRIVDIARRHGCAPILLAEHLPTPIATALLSAGTIDIAFLITASHNSADWNGVKIKAGRNGSVSGDLESRIDDLFRNAGDALGERHAGQRGGAVRSVSSAALVDDHHATLAGRIGACAWRGVSVVVDGLGGIAGRPIQRSCTKIGADAVLIGDIVPETFGGLQPDPTLAAAQARCRAEVLRRRADIGVILDGDGDRVVLVGKDGQVWQSQEILAALLDRLPARLNRQVDGPLLLTASTGTLLRRVAHAEGRTCIETGIGFKHIAGRMNALPRSIGIGAVGDFGFQAFGTDRDPFALLLLLAAAFPDPADIGPAIQALRDRFGTDRLHWFEGYCAPDRLGRSDIAAQLRERIARLGGVAVACPDGDKFALPDAQWLLVRPSTTEGGIRLYGELTRLALGRDLLRRVSDRDATVAR